MKRTHNSDDSKSPIKLTESPLDFVIYLLLKLKKGGDMMMAMFFAQRVILGKTEFNAVPAKLKAQVADILINECGLPELVPAEYGGTAEKA